MNEPATQMTTTETTDAGNMIEVIARAASDPQCDTDKMKALLDMQERILNKQAEHEFTRAMARAQKRMKPIAVDANNPQTKSKYATFKALDQALRPIYTDEGFSLSYYEEDCPKENHVRVCVDIDHEAGHSRKRHRDIPVVTTGMQGKAMMTLTHANASAVSYGMRYLHRMIWSIAISERDDDGNGAGAQTISEKQIADLNAKIDEAQDKEKLLTKIKKNYGVDNIGEIPEGKFSEVIARCNDFIKAGG